MTRVMSLWGEKMCCKQIYDLSFSQSFFLFFNGCVIDTCVIYTCKIYTCVMYTCEIYICVIIHLQVRIRWGCWISLSLSDCCFLWEISMLRSPLHSFMKKHFDKYLCQLIRSLCWTILSEAPSQPIKGKKRKWVPIHMFIELKTVKLPIKISTTLQFKYIYF